MADIQINVDTRLADAKIKGVRGLIREVLWLNEVGDAQIQWIRRNVASAGLETPWRRMSPNTVAARPGRRSSRHFSFAFDSRLRKGTFKAVSTRQVTVGIRAEHADLHHFGTRPHIITARRAAFLRFKTVDGIVFAKRVRHPGFPARPLIPSKSLASKISADALNRFVEQKIRPIGNR